MKSVELGMPGGKYRNNKDVRTVSRLHITAPNRHAALLDGGVIR
jgi:hypothetical protein